VDSPNAPLNGGAPSLTLRIDALGSVPDQLTYPLRRCLLDLLPA
jgi:hypothetical protein